MKTAHELRLLEIKALVLTLIKDSPQSLDEVTAKIMKIHHIPDDLIAYTLTKTPMQAYIAELERERLIEMKVIEGMSRAHFISVLPPASLSTDTIEGF